MQMFVSAEVVVVGQMCNCWGEEKYSFIHLFTCTGRVSSNYWQSGGVVVC